MARKGNKLSTRNTFIILTNGKETEKNYFELLRSYNSIYKIFVYFQNEDPLALVEYAIKHYPDANQVWCVFDVDSFHDESKVEKAIKKAKQNNIHIALSNISFEVWLLSHYKKCEHEKDAKELEREISKLLKNESNNKVQYSKSDKQLLEDYILPKTATAITNAQIVHENYIKDYNVKHGVINEYPIWKWNPCTTVYLLIKALKLQKC